MTAALMILFPFVAGVLVTIGAGLALGNWFGNSNPALAGFIAGALRGWSYRGHHVLVVRSESDGAVVLRLDELATAIERQLGCDGGTPPLSPPLGGSL